ncbi:hypothetical protein D3C84_1132420 [compost metagenome]
MRTVSDQVAIDFYNMVPFAISVEVHHLALVEFEGRFTSIVQPVERRLAVPFVERMHAI